jgi:hypothetical protein
VNTRPQVPTINNADNSSRVTTGLNALHLLLVDKHRRVKVQAKCMTEI